MESFDKSKRTTRNYVHLVVLEPKPSKVHGSSSLKVNIFRSGLSTDAHGICSTRRLPGELGLVAFPPERDSDEEEVDLLVVRSNWMDICFTACIYCQLFHVSIIQHKHWHWSCHQQLIGLGDSGGSGVGLHWHADFRGIDQSRDSFHHGTCPCSGDRCDG